MSSEYFDVIVVGGGHAACEAALASARTGASTLMLAINLDHIAQMSCNPAVGGIAKGHVVREIDALGGAMGRVTDAAALQFRLLNLGKGPAVWSPRAPCDKVCYQKAMKREVELQPNLCIRQGTACSFILENGNVAGVVSQLGEEFRSKAVVLATGTFLHGKMHYGLQNMPGGRAGDPPSVELAAALKDQLHLHVGRLKTGTPPRILGKSIDFSQMGIQGSDDVEEHFSFFPTDSVHPQVEHRNVPCHLVYSNQKTVTLSVDGRPFETQTGKHVFKFKVPISGEHSIHATAGDSHSAIWVRKVSQPNPEYRFRKTAPVINWFDKKDIVPDCYSIADKLSDIRKHPEAGAVIDQLITKAASARGEVAGTVKDNPALQRMMGRITLVSLLKQIGADESAMKQLNRILQRYKKV